MEKGSFVIPKIRLSFWQKTIIAMEDAQMLPGKYWVVWYDLPILFVLGFLFYLTFTTVPSGADSDLPGLFFSGFIIYIIIMAIRHYSWLRDHAEAILLAWGNYYGFDKNTPFFNQELNKWLGWNFYLYQYSIQRVIEGQTLLSLFAAEFFREKPWWTRRRDRDNRYYKILTFAYLQNLSVKENFEIVITSKRFRQNIFKKRGLRKFSSLTGVNEFDYRYTVWAKNGQEALKFLNPIVILALIHLTLPHEILISGQEVLISSHRHFTRRRVLNELHTISLAIADTHGGKLDNIDWEEALEYFRTNSYNFQE